MILKEIDFDIILFERTPYEGIFVSCIDEDRFSGIPKLTAHIVRIDPKCEIGLHYHDREEDWTEFIIFPLGGDFEIFNRKSSSVFSGSKPVYARVNSKEVYGIKNRNHNQPLFLISIIKPGFAGYKEIKSGLST
jgi:hypothetical protein